MSLFRHPRTILHPPPQIPWPSTRVRTAKVTVPLIRCLRHVCIRKLRSSVKPKHPGVQPSHLQHHPIPQAIYATLTTGNNCPKKNMVTTWIIQQTQVVMRTRHNQGFLYPECETTVDDKEDNVKYEEWTIFQHVGPDGRCECKEKKNLSKCLAQKCKSPCNGIVDCPILVIILKRVLTIYELGLMSNAMLRAFLSWFKSVWKEG